MTDMKNRTLHDKTWNIYSKSDWEAGWTEMMESGVYERGLFGDLMLLGIACGIRKIILIFNTSLESPHDPIYVCDPRKFGVQPDVEIPLVMAYNLSHYESMHPVKESDTKETMKLASAYLNGSYQFGKKDLRFFISDDSDIVDLSSKGVVEKEDREEHIKDFQKSLPDHLRGKRPRDMDKEEKKEYNNCRKKFSRSNASELQTKTRKEKDNIAKSPNRANETEDQSQIRKEKDKIDKSANRENEAQDKRQMRIEKDKIDKSANRANETQDQSQTRKEKDKITKAEKQKNITTKQAQIKREHDKTVKTTNRAKKQKTETEVEALKRKGNEASAKQLERAKHVSKSQYVARNAQHVLAGEQSVPELLSTKESIGKMDTICKYCNARKWENETSSLCCNGGKVSLIIFPPPPELIQSLLTGNSVEAKLFRENTRSFNNALALSSIRVNERKFRNGYNPSVIFEGKVCQMYGPLLPENGEEPKFAQLYVHDPSTEHTMRVKNMCLPTSLSKSQVKIITKTMQKLQDLLKIVNPFVRDFLS